MASKTSNTIRRALIEALAYGNGKSRSADYRVHIPTAIHVKAIREKLALTQTQFAARFGFSLDQLQHWELGKRQPDGSTRAYLIVIERVPNVVLRALRTTKLIGSHARRAPTQSSRSFSSSHTLIKD